MTYEAIRTQSHKVAIALGFPINPYLPPVETISRLRSEDEVVDRLLCLYVAAACAYGFKRFKARAWLESERLWDGLTMDARRFLDEEDAQKPHRFMDSVESIWALIWALGVVDRLDFSAVCSESLVHMVPDIKHGESSSAFRSKVKLRSLREVEEACDLAYCLQWAVRDAQYNGRDVPGTVPEYVIPERRRALQWLITDDPWDEVTMDT